MSDDKNALPPGAGEAWTGAEPPDGFAERMVGLWEAEQHAPATAAARRPSRWWWTAVAAAVAVLLFLAWPRPDGVGGGGALAAEGVLAPGERTEARVGARATVVAEAGASLRWTVDAGGRARVVQEAGDVFYRVERGGEFVVTTPHGDVRVLGTCFRVEMTDMKNKQLLAAGAAGAALSAAILVTVYEGKVLLANPAGEVRVAAGERGELASPTSAPKMVEGAAEGDGPAALGPAFTQPAPDATREELLARDEAQRQEITRLRQEMVALQTSGGGRRGPDRGQLDPEEFLNPSKEDLLEMAQNCEVRYDTPPLDLAPYQIDAKRAAKAGLSETERAAANRVLTQIHTQLLGELRAIYVEVTGDEAGADQLAPQALMAEIHEKSPEADVKEAHYRVSHERAGLIQPPADLQARPPAERYLRLMHRIGDEVEKGLAGVIGTDRAHAMRASDGGWGNRSRMMMGPTGCKPETPTK